jgi:hypothetical protein
MVPSVELLKQTGRGLRRGDQDLRLVGSDGDGTRKRKGADDRSVGVGHLDAVSADGVLERGIHLQDDVLRVGLQLRAGGDLDDHHEMVIGQQGPGHQGRGQCRGGDQSAAHARTSLREKNERDFPEDSAGKGERAFSRPVLRSL